MISPSFGCDADIDSKSASKIFVNKALKSPLAILETLLSIISEQDVAHSGITMCRVRDMLEKSAEMEPVIIDLKTAAKKYLFLLQNNHYSNL